MRTGGSPCSSSTTAEVATAAGFFIQTLGCPKNEADSDALARRLRAAGHREVAPGDAALVIVSTCGFIDAAKEESIAAILEAADFAHAHGARVAAVGCLVERYRAELTVDLPEVDVWCGLDTTPLLAALSEGGGTGEIKRRPVAVRRRPRPVHAFVKVSDGCDRACSYCAIPLIKGDYEAAAATQILAAAGAALRAGARELVLVGQDTSRWAQPGWGGLERLLAELAALEPAPLWLRLLYLQPEGVDEALLEALARHAVPYIDVPLQHASGAVLRRMRRAGDAPSFLRLLERVRSVLPGAAVRSTFIAGFPGETEEEFGELLDFVGDAGLAAAGVFAFDRQEGTSAAALPGQIDAYIAEERAARLGSAIDEVAARFWQKLEGRPLGVLVERGTSTADGVAVGRCALQAPDVDGRVLLTGRPSRRGEQVEAVAVGAVGYDVEAVVRSLTP
jgi:ribosomal protein S12 methylthiotransferase